MKDFIFSDLDGVPVANFTQAQAKKLDRYGNLKHSKNCLLNLKILQFLLVVLTLFISTGCGGTFQDGTELLEITSREWLPVGEQVIYKNSRGESLTFSLIDSTRTLENQLYETDPGLLFGINKYYKDTEQIVENYQYEDVQIKYELSMEMSNAGKTEFLKVWVLDYAEDDFYELSVIIWPMYYNEFTLVDSVVLGETIFYEVGELTYNERKYYFKKHQGLLGVEIANELWILEK